MTREEALKKVEAYLIDYLPIGEAGEIDEILSALWTEPCEDAISRQEALACFPLIPGFIGHHYNVETIRHQLKNLPSVNPKTKTGHWERVGSSSLIDKYECSECHRNPSKKYIEELKTWGWDLTDYCPRCGAKMEREEN